MAYSPEIRQAAYELYLRGHAPGAIAKQLKSVYSGQDTPSAKTLENWAYVPDEAGKTWSQKRYEAEAAAQAIGTKRFAGQQAKMMEGILKLQDKLMSEVLEQIEGGVEFDNLTQGLYALVNITKTAAKMTENRLAEEARRKDDIDNLMEALGRVVPKWNELQPEVLQEFRKLSSK